MLGLFALLLLSPTLGAQTFIYCSESGPSAFNPQITTDGPSHNATTHTVYNRLLEFEYGTTNLRPGLAESWSVSKDLRRYVFTLRRGVKFHRTDYFSPKREFNADDVLFSFNRQRLKKHSYHKVSGGLYDYFNGMGMGKLIKDIVKLDDYKVQITLHRAEAPFLSNLAMGFMSILSKEYGDKLQKEGTKEQIDSMPVGTGPFVFKKYTKDALIRYTRNEHYWGSSPKVEKLVFSIVPDASVRHQKLLAGECHLIIEPAPADLSAIKKNKNLKLMEGAGFNVGYLAINTSKRPFDNLMVRKAINHALNKEAYIKAIYLGNAIPAVLPLPPTSWGHNGKIEDYPYDPALARKLLAQAGFPKGFDTTIWTLPITRPYNPYGKKMGEMMQADLRKVGIKAELKTFDWPTYLKRARMGEHQLIQLGWSGDNGDPDNFLHILLGCDGVAAGSNVARWCDQEFDQLVSQAKTKLQQKTRRQLYSKAQEIFKAKAPWVPIAHSIIFRAMAKNVEGYKIDPLGSDIFSSVYLTR